MTSLRYSQIIHNSYVDGPGRRSVLFTQGCPLACPSCQSTHLWPAEGGRLVEVAALAAELIAGAVESQGRPDPNITISGGEPFAQAEGLAALVASLRERGAGHLIVYSGYTWEELQEVPAAGEALALIDVLVDGRYIVAQDSPWMQYRGSANQRVIDVPATLCRGELVLLDWDRPEIIITQTGEVLGTGPVIELLVGLGFGGRVAPARRCGQSKWRIL